MPNPTSKLNLVINGVTTQLDIHDANAVDLTNNQTVGGNKEFTGTTTAHDVIPSATDTYNFGSPSYQWNNAYIKSLTINGVACGDILTHNVSEFVDVSSRQTIGGEKTFSNLRTYFGRDISCYSTRKYGKNLNPTSNTYQYLNFSGNTVSDGPTNDWSSGYLEQVIDTNGGSRGRWLVQDTSENSVGLELWASGNDKQVRPYQNSTTDLGTSTKKWKSFNGINPGALSLPSISASGANAWIALDTTDWVKNAATSAAQKYTPPADGWLNIRVDNAIMLGLAITGGSNNYMHQMVRSETPNSLALLIPVFKNIEVAILVAGNDNLTYNRATFYPCQGNV